MASPVSRTSTSSSTSSASSSTGGSIVSTKTASTSASTNSSTVTVALKRRSLIPPRWKETVRVVGMSDCREAALTLAYAFAADDYAQYLVDSGDMHGVSAEQKWKLHVDILTYTVTAHVMSGLATTVGPEFDSVALWVPPGKNLDGFWTQLRSGMWRLHFQLSPEGKKRLFEEILPLLHNTKAEVLGDRNDDAWYLVYLGTKPSSQGRGYASKLLRDVIARADAEKRPIYLESSSLANNAYYKKFGFEVKREIFLERGPAPVRLSIMVREPRAPGSTAYSTSSNPATKKPVRG